MNSIDITPKLTIGTRWKHDLFGKDGKRPTRVIARPTLPGGVRMIGFVLIEQLRPAKRSWWKRKPRPTLRVIAQAISMLQRAEGMKIHAERDQCGACTAISAMSRDIFHPVLPVRLLADPEWVHRHIEAPGVRIQARLEDEAARA